MLNENLLVSALAAKHEARAVGTNLPVPIRLEYVGTGTVTSVTVTTATNIVLITSDGGTDTYAFNTYDTVGKLVDKINGDGIFKAMVLDALRSDATASQFVNGAISSSVTLDGNIAHTVWDVLADTSETKSLTIRVTPKVVPTGADTSPSNFSTCKRPRIAEISYKATLGSGGEAAGFRVYEVQGGSEVLRISKSSVSASEQQMFLNTPGLFGSFIDGCPGTDLVVRVVDSVTLADAAANFLLVHSRIE